jgi:predicted nucleic acid-binding protein
LRSSKLSDARERYDAPGPTLRVVLDTCILKLATFPAENNASALIFELARSGLIEAWVSPAILEEYSDVLGKHPEFVAEIVENFVVCHPLTELSVIRHEPDNRFLECALAAGVEFIVTVNTAPGHFDRKQYQTVSVMRPGEFLNLPDVGRLVKKLIRG